jgi:protein-tyrosine kinase
MQMSLSARLSKAAEESARETALGEGEVSSNGDGEVIKVRADASYPLLVNQEQVVASEHFGVLRSRLLNAQARLGLRSVIVTSPQKGEGKSLVSLNLAISLAQLERHRILLVDGDLRIKGISHLLKVESESGLSDFLRGKTSFASCIRRTNFPYLMVAGAGTQAEDCLPAILEGSRWPEFLEKAREVADLIIVDSVPVAAPIADFELLSAPCDATVLIVHLRKTTREALALTLQQMDSKLVGVIINNQEPQMGSDYHSYYYGRKK